MSMTPGQQLDATLDATASHARQLVELRREVDSLHKAATADARATVELMQELVAVQPQRMPEAFARYRLGERLIGAGAVRNAPQMIAPARESAYVGTPGGVIVRYTGANGYLADVSLWGTQSPDGPADQRAMVGLWVYRPEGSKGIGTGKLVAERVYVQDCSVGVRFGPGGDPIASPHNADCTALRDLSVFRCGVGVLLTNAMAMGNRIDNAHFGDVDACVRVMAGGDLWLDGGTLISPATVLDIDADARGTSHNNGLFTVRHYKLDQNAGGSTIVAHRQPSKVHVLLDAVHAARNNDQPVRWLDLSDGASVTIRDCYGLQAKSIRWQQQDRHISVTVESSRLAVDDALDLLDVGGSTGAINVVVRDCVGDWGARVGDYLGQVVGQLERRTEQ